MMPAEHADVVVVGAGIMGLSISWQLAALGRHVTLIEQFAPGHAHGSSHGGTRGHRYSYEDPLYARLAMDAELWWRVLERQSGRTLLTMTGGIDIGVVGSASFERTVATVEELGLEHRLIEAGGPTSDEVAPFVLPAGSAALVQPGAGLISAARAVEVLEAATRDASVSLLDSCRVISVDPGETEPVVVRFACAGEERVLYAREVVLAAGGWTGGLAEQSPGLQLPTPFPVRLLACEPYYLSLGGSPPRSLFFLHPDSRYPDGVYGQSQEPAGAPKVVKLGVHGGVEVDRPGEPSDATPLVDARALRDRFAEFLPAAAEAPISGSDRCYYSMTRDEQFIIDRAPGCPEVTVVAGFSGHGFKFAPLVGRAVAELVAEGEAGVAISSMRLARFSAPPG